jgi:hypothetical protein
VRLRAEPSVQRAAPAAAAAPALGALAAKCIVGAVVSAALDAAIQYGLHSWKERRAPWDPETTRSFRLDKCTVIISAVLGCVGGIVAVKWLEPLLKRSLPAAWSGAGATLLGRILLFVANKAGIGIPRFAVKWLLKLNCVSPQEAEALAPGVGAEEGTAAAPAPAGDVSVA